MPKSLIIFFFVATVLLINFVIPPFQNPDEPQHFAAVMGFANTGSVHNPPHAEIIRFMDQNQWWRYLGMGKPGEAPEKLERVPFLMGYYGVSDYTLLLNDILIYHFGVGKLIGLLAKGNVPFAYYVVRLISVLSLIGALYFFYRVFRNISEYSASPSAASWLMTGFFFILFLPQLLITAVATNPDCVSVFLGAIFFWGAFSLIRQDYKFRIFIILVSAVMVGLIVDRANFFMLPVSLFALLFSADRKNLKKIFSALLFLLAALALLFLSLKFFFPTQLIKGFNYANSHFPHGWREFISLFSINSFNKFFVLDLIDSFLLRFGWSAFSAAPAFYIIWLTIIALAVIGIFASIVKAIFTKKIDPNIPAKSSPLSYNARLHAHLPSRLIGFSLAAIFLQVIAVRMLATERNMFAQGRYFFPLVIPIAFLLVVGLKSFFDIFSKKVRLGTFAVKVFILFEFFFLNYVIWNDIIAVFHITLKSPHPGS